MDQAENLRKFFLYKEKKENQELSETRLQRKKTKVITITSGKGGVGKSNISLNLAIALADKGFNVVLLDADIGTANLNILANVSSKYNLRHIVEGKKNIKEIMVEGPKGIKLVSGISGASNFVNLDKTDRQKIINQLNLIDDMADFVLIDTGAGISENVLKFIFPADEVLLVTTTEPHAIIDAYSLLKTSLKYNEDINLSLVVNKADNIKIAKQTAEKIVNISSEFLNYKLEISGYILNDKKLLDAVLTKRPVLLKYPDCNASKCINIISKKLILKYSKTSDNFFEEEYKEKLGTRIFNKFLKIFR